MTAYLLLDSFACFLIVFLSCFSYCGLFIFTLYNCFFLCYDRTVNKIPHGGIYDKDEWILKRGLGPVEDRHSPAESERSSYDTEI